MACGGHLIHNPVQFCLHILFADILTQDNELIPSNPAYNVITAEIAFQLSRILHNHGIPKIMPKYIIGQLKIVQVKHD